MPIGGMICRDSSSNELGKSRTGGRCVAGRLFSFKDQGWCDMGKVWKFLQGKKTIITAIAMAGVAFSQSMGYLSPEQGQEILSWLGAIGLLALRSAIAKTEQVV